MGKLISPEALARFAKRYAGLVDPTKLTKRTKPDSDIEDGASCEVWPESKVCTSCSEQKLLHLFWPDKTGRFERSSKCAACLQQIRRERLQFQKIELPPPPENPVGFSGQEKRCTNCDRTLPVERFYSNRKEKDGYTYHCVDCTREYHNMWRRDNTLTSKRCKACNVVKMAEEFNTTRSRICNQCRIDRCKTYYNRNRKAQYAAKMEKSRGNSNQ